MPDLIDGLPLYRYEIPGGPVLYFREELSAARWEEWQKSYLANMRGVDRVWIFAEAGK